MGSSIVRKRLGRGLLVLGAFALLPALSRSQATQPGEQFLPTQAPPNARYVGTKTCALCHDKQAEGQRENAMARALESVAECEVLRAHPRLEFKSGKYLYTIERRGDQTIYTVTDGRDAISEPILWAFGKNVMGQTYVLRHNGRMYESRVSFYKDTQALDLTLGAPSSATPASLEEALGQRYLHCSLCGTEWHVPRGRCTHCGEAGAEKVSYQSLDRSDVDDDEDASARAAKNGRSGKSGFVGGSVASTGSSGPSVTLTADKDKAKRIGKDYRGTITLSGCFTASGGPEADRQDDVFAKKVLDALVKNFSTADGERVKAIEATIKTASVNTNQEKRDAHLRNPDFFDVEKYPAMTYKMKSYKKTADGYQAIGELTLHGVTKDITLTGSFNGVAKDPWGNSRAGFTAEGKLNRKDFGMVWSKTLDNGGLVVGDEVSIKLDIECIKVKP